MNRYAVVAEKAWEYSEETRKLKASSHKGGVKGKQNGPLAAWVDYATKPRLGNQSADLEGLEITRPKNLRTIGVHVTFNGSES